MSTFECIWLVGVICLGLVYRGLFESFAKEGKFRRLALWSSVLFSLFAITLCLIGIFYMSEETSFAWHLGYILGCILLAEFFPRMLAVLRREDRKSTLWGFIFLGLALTAAWVILLVVILFNHPQRSWLYVLLALLVPASVVYYYGKASTRSKTEEKQTELPTQ